MQWRSRREKNSTHARARREAVLQESRGAAVGEAGIDRMMNTDSATALLVETILGTEEYRTYAAELAKVKQFPEIKVQLDDFRKRNFELQTGSEIDFNMLDEFEREYQSIRENVLVADFLAAELELCKLMQRINREIVSALQFE